MKNRYFGVVCLAAMAAFTTPGHSQSAGQGTCFAVRGTIDLPGQKGKSRICQRDIDRLLETPVTHPLLWPKHGTEYLSMTCREYLDMVGYGNYTSSRVELWDEVPYMRSCGTLVALHAAKLGRTAFKSSSQALSLSVLPPTIAFHAATGDQYEELEQLEARGLSAADLVRTKQFARDTDISIRILAIADVDGDGINDYVVERVYVCTGQCSDSAYHVGYLSPRPGRKIMQWVPFDHRRIRLPNPSLQPTPTGGRG